MFLNKEIRSRPFFDRTGSWTAAICAAVALVRSRMPSSPQASRNAAVCAGDTPPFDASAASPACCLVKMPHHCMWCGSCGKLPRSGQRLRRKSADSKVSNRSGGVRTQASHMSCSSGRTGSSLQPAASRASSVLEKGSTRTGRLLSAREAYTSAALSTQSQARAWLCVDKAAEVYASLAESNRPVRVLPFSSTEEARDAAGCKDEPVRPLEQLMWLACVRTPPERLDTFESALFRLKRWPDLGNLPHEPHHMQWCGILTRQQAGLAALASNGGVSPAQTAAFLDACGELGILERTNATAAQIAAVQLPVLSKKGRERISLFKNILGRLRIFRS